MRIVSGGMTDLGRVRTNNEDCFRIVEPLNLFVLSDGMGGEAHGEVASELAVETIVKFCMDPQADAGGAPLSNLESFQKAFQCSAGAKMVRPPQDHCQVW